MSTLTNAHVCLLNAAGKLRSNYSRFIVNIWIFLVFVLVTSYAANLTSMLTVERLQPNITNIKSLIKNEDHVGYQRGSFVFELLKKVGFDENKLKSYGTVEEYANTFCLKEVATMEFLKLWKNPLYQGLPQKQLLQEFQV